MAEAPELEGLLDVDELLAHLVGLPVALRGVVDRLEDGEQVGAAAVGLGEVALDAVGRDRVVAAGEVAQELVVQATAPRAPRAAAPAPPGECAKTSSISRFLLPSWNSMIRYCSDWKPDASPSTPRNLTYSRRRQRRQHAPLLEQLALDLLDAREALLGRAEVVDGQARSAPRRARG